jgi:hypothetical protein
MKKEVGLISSLQKLVVHKSSLPWCPSAASVSASRVGYMSSRVIFEKSFYKGCLGHYGLTGRCVFCPG